MNINIQQALALDLGVEEDQASFVKLITEAPAEPDADKLLEDFHNASTDVQLSLGGLICLVAYWLFSTDVFSAQHPNPEVYIFPHHLNWLEKFVQQHNPGEDIAKHVGITDALLAIGLALKQRGLIAAEGEAVNTMAYHHHLSLILVFHPDIQVRNAATVFAGKVFHAERSDAKRFEILEDLFVNCDYASLKACAVQWLKEEIIDAVKSKSSSTSTSTSTSTTSTSPSTSQFLSPETIDRLQHYVFPDLLFLAETQGGEESNNPQTVLEYWALNGVFLLQAANFAYFLFNGASVYREIVPPGMGAAVEHRFAEPLIGAAGAVRNGLGWEEEKASFGFAVDRLCDVGFQ